MNRENKIVVREELRFQLKWQQSRSERNISGLLVLSPTSLGSNTCSDDAFLTLIFLIFSNTVRSLLLQKLRLSAYHALACNMMMILTDVTSNQILMPHYMVIDGVILSSKPVYESRE